jgi:hypothetical protein
MMETTRVRQQMMTAFSFRNPAMKLRALFATVILCAATSLTSVHAQAPDPCTLYTCMAGEPGVVGLPGGPGCTAAIAYWHSPAPAGLAVYDDPTPPYFDSFTSASVRRTYLQTCPGSNVASNAAILETIITEYGYLP